ncbi:50S ribosomal protein L20 [Candidatus Campbellbacteria bacterium RIFCSPLOWO2_01_FULL_34_15]|jgi:large subunit ribosomal protein L20|uniref:Large ribosomal subunit protein bL20 n=2 Tax=Candidatus Campbelliibacteriota TaxID=1752727 RepID=A0A1F5ENV9_9BACT|nr:MAG: 50S ribosomal protein L20 [Candidatus Campbellbacteria bacterium RIFCSPHIGHO2_01_FULL_34_10]OGD68926.1 MAG: 50S ribosomal protein L20 [Candidatus Campbellbacteria bacterium RIFCSPLOWO2_01_FULL_34_15]
MTRVKRGTTSLKRRKKVLKLAKGFRNARSTKERQAHEALMHAGVHAFAHRRDKKNDFRRLWQTKMNAGLRAIGFTYSKFTGELNKKGITLNRKMLAEIAEKHPETLERIVKQVTSATPTTKATVTE